MRFLIRHQGILMPVLITALVLWAMILPGYVLSFDLLFTPHYWLNPVTDGFTNSLPLWYLIKLFYTFMPGWIIEKTLLVALFFSISYFSFNYLPVPKKFFVKLFASLLYTVNTFVYVRMLAGQWTHLFAYAFLPLLIHLLFAFTKELTYKRAIQLGAVLALIGLFSLQLFVIAILASLIWLGLDKAELLIRRDFKDYSRLILPGIVFLITLFVLTSYWTIPALLQHAPITQRFDATHWEAFAASAHGSIPVLLNLSMLGGFWAESQPWANYFVWPQTQPVFWIAFALVLLLSVLGLTQLFRTRQKRTAVFFILLSTISIIFGAGAAATPFYALNLFFYEHVPFWSGFRDSQKWIALLALSYAVLAGYGFSYVLEKLERVRESYRPYLIALLFLIPIFFGIFCWGEFAKQLRPVWYPASWERAYTEITQHPSEKLLILPWQGYFSLSFNHYLITANPAGQYFGPQAVVSQNVRLEGVYDQSADPAYEELDRAIRHNSPLSGESMHDYLKSQGIGYVIYFQDITSIDPFTYQFLHSDGFTLEWQTPELFFYKID